MRINIKRLNKKGRKQKQINKKNLNLTIPFYADKYEDVVEFMELFNINEKSNIDIMCNEKTYDFMQQYLKNKKEKKNELNC